MHGKQRGSVEACLPPKAPKNQVDVKCMFRDWLGTRAMLWLRSFNCGRDTRGLLA